MPSSRVSMRRTPRETGRENARETHSAAGGRRVGVRSFGFVDTACSVEASYLELTVELAPSWRPKERVSVRQFGRPRQAVRFSFCLSVSAEGAELAAEVWLL